MISFCVTCSVFSVPCFGFEEFESLKGLKGLKGLKKGRVEPEIIASSFLLTDV